MKDTPESITSRMETQTKETRDKLTPGEALQLLKEGNERFANNHRAERDLLQQVRETSAGQFPFATVLSCIDSRVSSELIFDQGLGDLFSIRVAGNVVNEDVLGSLEFACKIAGAGLVVVLGHTKCGAVKGACDNVTLGNLTGLLAKIKPSIDQAVREAEGKDEDHTSFVRNVTKNNVFLTIQGIKEQSSVLNEMAEAGQIKIIGALYDVDTGRVTFYENGRQKED